MMCDACWENIKDLKEACWEKYEKKHAGKNLKDARWGKIMKSVKYSVYTAIVIVIFCILAEWNNLMDSQKFLLLSK